jgi:hypothetical protein
LGGGGVYFEKLSITATIFQSSHKTHAYSPTRLQRFFIFFKFLHLFGNFIGFYDFCQIKKVNNWDGGYEDTVVPMWQLRENIDLRIEPHIVVSDYDPADFLPEIERTGIELV